MLNKMLCTINMHRTEASGACALCGKTFGRDDRRQARTLAIVLALNFFAFIAELAYGFSSGSMGLVADSLDMLADACSYGLSLWAIGHAVKTKRNVAKLIGWSQVVLISAGVIEAVRRFAGTTAAPDYPTMIYVSLGALAINAASLILLQKLNSRDANIRASVLCSSVDVLTNVGVIMSAVLVMALDSATPDLVISLIVFWAAFHEAREMIGLGNGKRAGG
ncbi:MAG: cation transporter [Rickettsiales bacterium]|jgi:Co/Zn/Cd efflux system component|nr:cation transporter [Rickettsiales bacterium]